MIARAPTGGPAYGPLSADQQALVTCHLRLAYYYARPWVKHLPVYSDDLDGEAVVGLVKAAGAWDAATDGPFPLFARGWIRAALKAFVKRLRPKGWRSAAGQAPVTCVLEVQPRDLREAPVGALIEELDQAEAILRKLPPRHAAVCRAMHVQGEGRAAIARRLGCSPNSVNRIHAEAVSMLRLELSPLPQPAETSHEDERCPRRVGCGIELETLLGTPLIPQAEGSQRPAYGRDDLTAGFRISLPCDAESSEASVSLTFIALAPAEIKSGLVHTSRERGGRDRARSSRGNEDVLGAGTRTGPSDGPAPFGLGDRAPGATVRLRRNAVRPPPLPGRPVGVDR
jgi:RNA polymerase sigma factor (sigma-70 family)